MYCRIFFVLCNLEYSLFCVLYRSVIALNEQSPSPERRPPIMQSAVDYIPGDEAKYWKEQYQDERKHRDKLQGTELLIIF